MGRSVSALEMFRLDLLRLHARGTDIGSITADLQTALELSRRMEHETSAQDEIADVIARTASISHST